MRSRRRYLIFFLLLVPCFLVFIWFGSHLLRRGEDIDPNDPHRPPMQIALLTPNPYSRPHTTLRQVQGIVVHYTANPGASAMANRNYFEGLKDSHKTRASSHFIVGIEGEIVQCIPTSEWSFASNDRNRDTISIEVCHPDETGRFTKASQDSLVRLCAYLMERFDLTSEDVIRHYDVTGKICPKYFVEHPDAWQEFRNRIGEAKDALRKDS